MSRPRRPSRPRLGSWTQLGHFHDGDGKLGKPVAAALPIATLDQLAFAGWDMHGEDALTVAENTLRKLPSQERLQSIFGDSPIFNAQLSDAIEALKHACKSR